MRVILASKSPRRRELLLKLSEEMGFSFEVITGEVDESVEDGTAPYDAVRILAERKGRAVASLPSARGALVISSDTLVELDGVALGKPATEQEARDMLSSISGRGHFVRTGVAVFFNGNVYSDTASTEVIFENIPKEEMEKYIESGSPMDKAGAYGIQDYIGKYVCGYRGDYDTVVGLSLALTRFLIKKALFSKNSKSYKRARLSLVIEKLKRVYPDASCALEYGGDPWKLLVMGRLSAQCTDKRVNLVSSELFARYPTPQAMANADLQELCDIVRPCGLYRVKAENIRDASALLINKYNGRLPSEMDELLTFPGVGRKIANLLIGDVFSLPAIVCDTHCIRIAGRLGAYPESEKNPSKIEKILRELIDDREGSDFCHRIVLFGRDTCTARSPDCKNCPLKDLCLRNAAESGFGGKQKNE